MRKQVEAYIRQNGMLTPGDCVVAGVSGGADSVCLLWVLKEMRVQWNLTIVAVHVHHGIRGHQADEDEAYVQKLCEMWNIECRCIHVDVPLLARQENMTVEEAGRKARYDAFAAAAAECGAVRIAVAHHMDDNVETILMNLFRGSGLKGISGIEPVRDNVIRPLLCVRRNRIEEFLREQNITWRTDATNLEAEYTRNKIRLTILPAIYEAFPSAGEHILQTAGLAAEADKFMAELSCKFIDQYGAPCYNGICMDRKAFLQQDAALQKMIVRQALVQVHAGLKDVTGRHIEEACLLARKPVGKSVSLPGGWQVRNGYDTLSICQQGEEENRSKGNWRMETSIFPYKKNEKFPENQYTKWFDYDTITDTIVLRTRKTGDRIQVHPDGTKKLKDYMIDARIPREQRDQIPVVASGNQILWVAGYRISEAFKVREHTKNIIQITLIYDNQEETGGPKDGR